MSMIHRSLFLLLSFFFINVQAVQPEGPLEVVHYSSEEIVTVLPLLQKWVEREFAKYPYLWVAPKDTVYLPNEFLARDARSSVFVVQRSDEPLAIVSCILFDSFAVEPSLQAAFPEMREKGFNPSQMLYVPYCLVSEEARKDEQLITLIDERMSEYAKKIGCNQICFITDLGKPDHPLKPESYLPIEPWEELGGFEKTGVEWEFSWPTQQLDGSVQVEPHTITLFYKDIG